MTLVYYNEIDPFAAEWLRRLMIDGLIAWGDVDERSIEDVSPDDLRPYTQCHFFAGIGVWSHALRGAGWSDDRSIWTGSCPCQPFSAAGKGGGFADERHLWPAFFHLINECRPAVVIGEQVASKDGLAWLDLVSADVEGAGYAFGAADLCAAGFGAPHIRQRSYWLAHAEHPKRRAQRLDGEDGRDRQDDRRQEAHGVAGACSEVLGLDHHHHAGPQGHAGDDGAASGRQEPGRSVAAPGVLGGLEHDASDGRQQRRAEPSERSVVGGCSESAERSGPVNGWWRDADWLGCRDGKWRPVEPGTFPLAHGSPARVGRLRGYGNAIAAPVAQGFIEAVMECLP